MVWPETIGLEGILDKDEIEVRSVDFETLTTSKRLSFECLGKNSWERSSKKRLANRVSISEPIEEKDRTLASLGIEEI